MRNKLSPLFIILLLSLFLAPLFGCGTTPEETEAEALLNSYFKYLKKENYFSMHSLYAKSAFGVVSSSKALRGMKKTMKSFGPLETYEYDRGSTYIKDDSKTNYTLKLSYEVRYKNMRTREGFLVTRKRGQWLIMSHTIERL
jgi:hypothetical protein